MPEDAHYTIGSSTNLVDGTAFFRALGTFFAKYELKQKNDDDITTSGINANTYQIKNFTSITNISSTKYIYIKDAHAYDESFDEFRTYNKLTQAINKVSSYAALISKQLDGKGKEEINDIENLNKTNYDDYSLTTIFNFLVGGFESIVNNQGSITDYSNYASLKYLIKSINNKLDLRSTYLTMLNVHRNNVLDLNTDLAKNNVSVILGDETLEFLYTTMDKTVSEINYLITNIILTILNKEYTIQDLVSFYRVDKPTEAYARYFSKNNKYSTGSGTDVTTDPNCAKVDPLGVDQTYDKLGTVDTLIDGNYVGIMPLLENYLIDLIGENHLGIKATKTYNVSLYDKYINIKNGFVLGGLTQADYEDFYERLNNVLTGLTSIHNIINAFINEKYITEIIDLLVGSLNLDSTTISYNGRNFTVNTLMEYYNQGLDEELTQEKVLSLISNSINPNISESILPYEPETSRPIYMYPYFCIQDIKDSIYIAGENLEIVKNNITKQDHVLATLNTLCYDNLVQDINGPIGFAEGSDGDFTYDNSSSAKLKTREHRINDIRIKAYKGTWNDDVLNTNLYEFDHILDANYEDSVKNAIITLARDNRQDFFYWGDCKKQLSVADCLDWKASFTNQTYFMSLLSQSQVWYDEYTNKNIELTSTYLIADLFPRHIASSGIHYPMAGSRRGVVGGFIANSWYPNDEQMEKLYKAKVNYIERDTNVIRIGSQNTNYPTGPLGSINNVLIVLKIKRQVEKIAKTYQFEFNTEQTRSSCNAEINTYLSTWINNGACTLATSSVYATEYDIAQKIMKVDIELKFTGVLERIVISINCPAA